jgi:hypothetical protein
VHWDIGVQDVHVSWFVLRAVSVCVLQEATIFKRPARIFREYPREVMSRVSYFNIPANTTVGNADNPMDLLLDLAKEEDFVVVKIDIDLTPVEMAFIHRIINTPQLAELIDELYFENHVVRSPMAYQGWNLHGNKEMTLPQSYEIFMQMRKLGILAHSWV